MSQSIGRFHEIVDFLGGKSPVNVDKTYFLTLQSTIINCIAAPKFWGGQSAIIPEKSFFLDEFPGLPYSRFVVEFDENKIFDDCGVSVSLPCAYIFEANKTAEPDRTINIFYLVKGPTGWCEVFRATLFAGSCDYKSSIESADTASSFVNGAINTVGNFLNVINCSNVHCDEINPGRFQNQRRERKGKSPKFVYKILTLKAGAKNRSVSDGFRAEPVRVHLVRGHIKRRKTGNFWWQPFVRGDPSVGVIAKDYRADKRIGATA